MSNAPRLISEFGFDRDLIDRDPAASEALDELGFFEQAARAVEKFQAAERQVKETVLLDKDLTDDARARRAHEHLDGVAKQQLAKLDPYIEQMQQTLGNVEQRLVQAGRPPADQTIEKVARAVRVADARMQLAAMPHPDRIRVVMAMAQAGDLVAVEGAESSLIPLVPQDVIEKAREAYAMAKAADLVQTRDALRRQIGKAARTKAEVAGKMSLTTNRYSPRRTAA